MLEYNTELELSDEYFIIKGKTPFNFTLVKSKTVWLDKSLRPVRIKAELFENFILITEYKEYKELKFDAGNDSIFEIKPPAAKEMIKNIYFESIQDAKRFARFIIEPKTELPVSGVIHFGKGETIDISSVKAVYSTKRGLRNIEFKIENIYV